MCLPWRGGSDVPSPGKLVERVWCASAGQDLARVWCALPRKTESALERRVWCAKCSTYTPNSGCRKVQQYVMPVEVHPQGYGLLQRSVARCVYGRCLATYTPLCLLQVLGADQNLTPDRG